MGLKEVKFIDWFQGKFPHASRVIARHEGAHFDSVFIDVNCILHPAMRAAKNESMFVKKLYTILDKTLSQFIPDRICYLSVDGPAPLAKLLTQKARRASKGSSGKPNHMSTLQVTPGCPFMLRLEQYLSYYTVRYLQHRRSQGISPDLKFVIDHSNNPGEGESKIIENVVQQASNIRGRPCAILSMDSDAIIQAITLGMPNVFVVRKDAPQNPIVVISIDKFMRSLEGMFPGEANRTRLDFCALCLFRGNDYLRGLFVGLEKLWLAYLYTRLVDPAIQTRGSAKYLIDANLKTFDLFFLKQLILNSYKDNKSLNIPDNLTPQPVQQQQKEQEQQQQTSLKRDPEEALEESEQEEYANASDMESQDGDSIGSDDETGGNIDATGSGSDIENSADQENKPYSVKDYLEGVLWNLEMYCSGVCPDVSFTYRFRTAPPRRAIVTYVDTIAQKKPYQTLSPSSTKKLVSVVRSDKTYLHPLVCAMILLPIDRAGAYLPESMALVHSSIVPGDTKNLVHEEMMVIEETVHGIIQVLANSHKPQDVKVSQELYGLYNTRSPYIWTRVRVVRPRTPKSTTPPSPSVIIDALQNLSISAESNNASQQGRFVDLECQQDIICTLTKVLPSAAQTGQSNRVPAIVVQWAVDLRQTDITSQVTRPSAPWSFFSLRQSRFGRPGPGQQQQHRPRQLQHQQHPHQQQGRTNDPDTRKPQTARRATQPTLSVDSSGQPGRRSTRPSVSTPAPVSPIPAAQVPSATATAATSAHNGNQRNSRRKPGVQQQDKRAVEGNVGNEILVSSAN